MKEQNVFKLSGLLMVVVQFLLIGFVIYSSYRMYEFWDVTTGSDLVLPILAMVSFFIMFGGYVTIAPNEYSLYQFLGKYKGTIIENGFFFVNPFYGVMHGSFKIENFQTDDIMVNEKAGVPIEIAAIISYRVKDTYMNHYNVEDAESYVKNQFEISLRQHAKLHTYSELSSDDHEFVHDLTEKVSKAGVEIIEAKITHLSYATEIASAMLQKQQAVAMSEAKQTIVENAVSIAKHAAESMNGSMMDQDKSKFIANLIVVLCSDKSVSPVVAV